MHPKRQNLEKLLIPLPGLKATAVIDRDRQVISPFFTISYRLASELGAGPNTIRISPHLVLTLEQSGFAVDTIAECLNICAPSM